MRPCSTKVVYTAVFGNYDKINSVNPEWDCDFICFTDTPGFVSVGWNIIEIPKSDESFTLSNRRYKILPHQFLSNYEYSLYVDGNIGIVSDPSPLFCKYLRNDLIALPKHLDRNCAYKEALLCIKGGRTNNEITENQMRRYVEDGFPKNNGMTENGIIFRKHNDLSIIALMNYWWEEYCKNPSRDQLSLPYVLWKNKIRPLEVVEGFRTSTKFFTITPHTIYASRSFLKRFIKKADANKHIAYRYFILSKIFYVFAYLKSLFKTSKFNF